MEIARKIINKINPPQPTDYAKGFAEIGKLRGEIPGYPAYEALYHGEVIREVKPFPLPVTLRREKRFDSDFPHSPTLKRTKRELPNKLTMQLIRGEITVQEFENKFGPTTYYDAALSLAKNRKKTPRTSPETKLMRVHRFEVSALDLPVEQVVFRASDYKKKY